MFLATGTGGDWLIAQYRQLFAFPGATGFFLFGMLAVFPTAMRPLGCVLLVSGLTGSYALAGATSAALTLSQAAASPRLGRLADRFGHRRVVLPTLAGHTLGVLGLIVVAQRDAPAWTLLGRGGAVRRNGGADRRDGPLALVVADRPRNAWSPR